jgi:hypothetical protein
MTTDLTQAAGARSSSGTGLQLAVRMAIAIIFWAIAATLVVIMHQTLAPISVAASVVAKVFTILFVAFAYIRLVARECTFDQALVTGALWLILGIVAEITVSRSLGTTWFVLLGSPANPLGRDVLLFAWVVAPPLFARRKA